MNELYILCVCQIFSNLNILLSSTGSVGLSISYIDVKKAMCIKGDGSNLHKLLIAGRLLTMIEKKSLKLW